MQAFLWSDGERGAGGGVKAAAGHLGPFDLGGSTPATQTTVRAGGVTTISREKKKRDENNKKLKKRWGGRWYGECSLGQARVAGGNPPGGPGSGGGRPPPRARRGGEGGAGDAGPDTRRQSGFYGLSAANIDKKAVNFDRFKGKVVLVTNVASR